MRSSEIDAQTARNDRDDRAGAAAPPVTLGRPRWLAASGIVFVGLFILWLGLHGMLEPAGGQPRPSDREIVSYLVENEGRLHLSHFVLGLAAVAFLSFLGTLRAALIHNTVEGSSLPSVAFAAGLVVTILMLVSGSILPGMADVVKRGGVVEPAVAGALFDLVGSIFSLAPFAVATLVGVTSITALRSRLMPGWIGWAGLLIVLLLLAGTASIDLTEEDPLWFVGIFAMVLWLAWTVVVSLALFLRSRGGNSWSKEVSTI
jgi:hypothetical protein